MKTTAQDPSRGYTLIELLVTIVIIAGLATLVLPATDRVLHRARAATCMGNLRNLGSALNLYLTDHNNVMPTLVIARDSDGGDELTLDVALAPYTEEKKVYHCPADVKKIWEKTGTSYLWNNLLNGQNVAALDFFGIVKSGSRIPVMSDKENFHKYRDVEVNILYADGHVAKELQFTVGNSWLNRMISVKNLTKRFTAARPALDDVSFEVSRNEIVGLLGHNGAGKSTVLGIMLGMVRPNAGEVVIGGHSVQRDRGSALRQIGAIFEAPSFYEYMTGWDNLRMLCALSGWWDEKEVWRVLELVNLKDRVRSKVAAYSHGMRQRLALAQALLPEPKCLLLDEPTDGLDPEGIHEFRTTVLRLREERGLTILLNSHQLSEVEQMCDRCVILREGKKVYEGSVRSREAEHPRFRLDTADMDLARNVAQSTGVSFIDGRTLEITNGLGGPELLARLVQAGVRVDLWAPERKTLEDWYLELTQGGRG